MPPGSTSTSVPIAGPHSPPPRLRARLFGHCLLHLRHAPANMMAGLGDEVAVYDLLQQASEDGKMAQLCDAVDREGARLHAPCPATPCPATLPRWTAWSPLIHLPLHSTPHSPSFPPQTNYPSFPPQTNHLPTRWAIGCVGLALPCCRADPAAVRGDGRQHQRGVIHTAIWERQGAGRGWQNSRALGRLPWSGRAPASAAPFILPA